LALRLKVLGADRVKVQQESRRKFWQDMRNEGKLEALPQCPQPPAHESDE
jgi:hypothetical protein